MNPTRYEVRVFWLLAVLEKIQSAHLCAAECQVCRLILTEKEKGVHRLGPAEEMIFKKGVDDERRGG